MASLPSSQRGVTVVETGKITVSERPMPSFEDDKILIKVVAVTLNPTDNKHFGKYALLKPGDALGCDFAGDIVEIGKNVAHTGLQVGDAVAGFIRGGFDDSNNGSFQEYVKAFPEMVWKVPKDILSYEDAAAMGGIALSTAVYGLYHKLDLPTPWEPAKEPFPIVIWSGATSVGIFAIRLAKLSGLQVATTASPDNHEYLKSLGADVVFDYKDPDAPSKIKDWSKGRIRHGYDTISEHGTPKNAAKAFGDVGGTLITLLPVEKSGDDWPQNVEPLRIYIYTVLKRENKEDHDKMAEWNEYLSSSQDLAKNLKVMPLKHWEGGLDAIPAALQYLDEGKMRAGKISLLL
ncbi:hypothetical protein FRC03_012264 [Tulasnella sp. 419]|nr:hypothetical protein FRC03_012264 [Tulasnella sp. 419]